MIQITRRLIGLSFFLFLHPFLAYLINVTFFDWLDCDTENLVNYLQYISTPKGLKSFVTFDQKPKTIKCSTNPYYQSYDKLTDLLVDLIAMFYFKDTILIILFLARFIGTLCYFLTGNTRFFFYFPHFFQIYYLISTGFSYFDITNKSIKNIFLAIGFLYKVYGEYQFYISPDLTI